MRLKILGAACVAFSLSSPPKAEAYAIDCAILLCLAGGFPASAECSAAKVELIRRITPWPIEPPLQLWNCPFRAAGLPPLPNMGRDGLTPEIRQYRDGIELYHVNYWAYRTSDGMDVSDSTQRGSYDDNGDFSWSGARLADAPAWLHSAIGYRANGQLRARGIAMRITDYSGDTQIDWITY